MQVDAQGRRHGEAKVAEMIGKPLIIWIMAVSLLCAGCLREEEVDFSQVRGAIVGGEPASLPEDTVAVALALRFGEETLAFCSGALIAPDVVLTAAHCLDSISTFSFKAIWEAGLVRVVAGESIDAEEASYYEVLRYVVHPAFDMEAARHDLGMLWLDRPVPDAYTYPILEDVASVIQMAKDNHEVRFLGYGLDEEERDGQRLKVSGTVSRICSQKRTLHSEDCIVKLESGAYLTLPYGTFLHSLEEGGPCHGDSGGPVLAQWKGETYLVGLVSGGDGECRVMGITTLLAMRSGWIKRQLYGDDGSDCHAGNLRSSRPVDERTGIVPWLAVILLALGRVFSTLWPQGRRALKNLGGLGERCHELTSGTILGGVARDNSPPGRGGAKRRGG